jgi:hypothetical protein
MKLEVGMYVRTKRKGIAKIDEIIDDGVITYEDDLGREWEEETGRKVIRYIGKDGWNSGLDEKKILKASYNIIDILEKGDYVNGSEVLCFESKYVEEDDKFVPIGVITENCYLENTDSWIIEKDIKSVITHEQMEQMAYKVGE